jgi:5'-deoxynucleotidase YfbR-like HD superfamily hydrolase
MSIKPKNKNRPKLNSLPKIEKPIIRGHWDCTPPEEQGIGFAPWDHQEKDCYCQKYKNDLWKDLSKKAQKELSLQEDRKLLESLDFDPNHDVGSVDPWEKRARAYDRTWEAQQIGPECFGGSDYPSVEELESEIKSFYTKHPEITAAPALRDAWIQTHTGKKFYPQNPTVDSICIEDIAHALANQCRFTGHTSVHYSVAQHCVLVSYLCNPENALQGLLHDAAEAYVVDLASPIKKLPEMAGYRELEKKVQRAVYHRFLLSEEEPADVKKADLLMLSIESNSFMAPLHPDWKMSISIPTLKIEPLSPQAAKELFLQRFNQLWLKTDI